MSEASETNQHPVTEFTIDRSRWARRGKNGQSRLLNDEGGMCCLGFLGAACGVSQTVLYASFNPCDLGPAGEAEKTKWPSWLFDNGAKVSWPSNEAYSLMMANDGSISAITSRLNGDKSEEALEAFITKTFANRGVTVHFVDGPVTA